MTVNQLRNISLATLIELISREAEKEGLHIVHRDGRPFAIPAEQQPDFRIALDIQALAESILRAVQ